MIGLATDTAGRHPPHPFAGASRPRVVVAGLAAVALILLGVHALAGAAATGAAWPWAVIGAPEAATDRPPLPAVIPYDPLMRR